MDRQESPLISALPPETDYISYLTIVEQYLSEQTLPMLHKVLQDGELTSNIGWDLVQLLVPMLPASADCLQDIARLGNPREVILKVTEALLLLQYNEQDDEPPTPSKPRLTIQTPEKPVPAFVVQFDKLLSMLTLLHARIKTTYPSRFLSTTLKAVLDSFRQASVHKEEMIVSIVHMVKKMRGILRPTLPSRSSSASLVRKATGSTVAGSSIAGSDPEASTSKISPEEDDIQAKLFQAFVTHILEDYMLTLQPYENVPGLAWSTRIMDMARPERFVPRSKPMSKRFQEDQTLVSRNDAVGQLVSLAHDLRISNDVLLKAAMMPEEEEYPDDDEPPASSAVIPLSQTGAVLLLAARQSSDKLHGREAQETVSIFAEHNELLINRLGTSYGDGLIGSEPEALIDACLVLGLLSLENDKIGTPTDDTQFKEYLMTASLLASNCPNSNLRGHAHYLVTTLLRSHPDDKVRYAFIRDTLEHCDIENLKTAAIGWLKGEIVEANMIQAQTDTGSVFRSSITLATLAPMLFPAVEAKLVAAPLQAAWIQWLTDASFHLAMLNFLYLIIAAHQIRDTLDIRELWVNNDIAGSYIEPLEEADKRFKAALQEKDPEIPCDDDTEREAVLTELNILTNALAQVKKVVPKLNE